MYCAACGTPLAPGLSFCNRCGMSLKERSEQPKTNLVNSYLTAIGVIGVSGLSLMLGGAIALKNGANFTQDLIAVYMLMTFILVGFVELFVCRQLSRHNRAAEKRESPALPAHLGTPVELRGSQPRGLPEPLTSVTENTTRTLEYSRNDPSR
jgi:NhaP-type Na+/H+ or K+/H+ antiporter